MGLLDDFSSGPEKRPEPKPEERPPAGHRGVKLELQEEKVSLTAGQIKEYPVVLTNTGTDDDMIRVKVDLVYDSEIPDPPEWGIKLWGVVDKAWDVTFSMVTE